MHAPPPPAPAAATAAAIAAAASASASAVEATVSSSSGAKTRGASADLGHRAVHERAAWLSRNVFAGSQLLRLWTWALCGP